MLNLLLDPWIAALRDGRTVAIRPDQIAEPGVTGLAWPRADFNLACLELLIGLVSLADPPKDGADWLSRLDRPDAGRLRRALAPFAPCFSLGGDGPRFLQDFETLERGARKSDIKPVDMLYIDSAGDSTARNNADLMVRRNRFASLSPMEAAMALYTLQAFAPSGGAGNRTSMRGGGPMTTLVHPVDGEGGRFALWRLVFANVQPGSPVTVDRAERALPWLRPTRTSRNGEVVTPEHAHAVQAFFGMSRRLRLVFAGERVSGVVQKPHGTDYKAWIHPLTPYYRPKEDSPKQLPVHPKPGRLSYRNWLGITMEPKDGNETRRPALTVSAYHNYPRRPACELLVGGWAMDNMKPVSFSLDRYPGFPGLTEDVAKRIRRLVEAANAASGALRKALVAACRMGGTAADAAIEAFFAETEGGFVASVGRIVGEEGDEVEEAWYATLQNQALGLFDERAVAGLGDHDVAGIERRVTARRNLLAGLRGQVRRKMELPVPGRKEART